MISWENIINHICVEKSGKKEITIHFTNGKLADDYILFRGQQVHSPFKPWYLAAKYNLKESSAEDISKDLEQKFLNWIS